MAHHKTPVLVRRKLLSEWPEILSQSEKKGGKGDASTAPTVFTGAILNAAFEKKGADCGWLKDG